MSPAIYSQNISLGKERIRRRERRIEEKVMEES
jgi:hypothetical protein